MHQSFLLATWDQQSRNPEDCKLMIYLPSKFYFTFLNLYNNSSLLIHSWGVQINWIKIQHLRKLMAEPGTSLKLLFLDSDSDLVKGLWKNLAIPFLGRVQIWPCFLRPASKRWQKMAAKSPDSTQESVPGGGDKQGCGGLQFIVYDSFLIGVTSQQVESSQHFPEFTSWQN